MSKITFKLFIFSILYFCVYSYSFCNSCIYPSDNVWEQALANKDENIKKLITSLDAGNTPTWLEKFAPLVWWHPDEKYKTTDPEELLEKTEIWYREIYPGITFLNREFVNLGPFNKFKLNDFRHKDYTPTDEVTRLLEYGAINKGFSGFELRYDPDQKMERPAPAFWRLGKNPLFSKIQSEKPNEILVPIEFWYHSNYNDTGIFVANHDGDWESSLILLKLVFEAGEFKVYPYMVSPTAHGGSSWFCDHELNHQESHVELFTALGTHATYATEGYHWRFIYPDRTARGTPWQTWNLLKPVVKENFYGFSGSWGRSSFIHFQSAPIAPGPRFKYLPAQTDLTKATATFAAAAKSCKL